MTDLEGSLLAITSFLCAIIFSLAMMLHNKRNCDVK